MRISRRTALGALLATAAAPPGTDYAIAPRPVADGIWVIAGEDAPIERDNGGAVANIIIIATPAGTVLVDCGPSFRFAKSLKALAERLAGKPVVRVYLTHLHPDHGLGIAAFDQAIVAALPATIAGIENDGQGFSDAMYRLLGDWMRGTDLVKPGVALSGNAEDFGGRRLRLLALSGHSAGDLAVLDEATGTLIAGDLVFHDRAPSTPTADLAAWRQSLDALAALPHGQVVPGHGAVDPGGAAAIAQTRDWLDWLEASLRTAVGNGLDMVEAGRLPMPDRFAALAAARYELQRSVSHLYPALEADLLPRIDLPE
ncbi:quinoprotein relay system zinc metallohydrolase 1 [Sphingomonas zeicaulis]|uniref:quinoprotein relay system zinc metallohydrolase 1 n=1 Tax=Sphingomonas zeicaulis TaxID=1632740 RepID=UPI003D263439